jgi:hypothetical protein
VSFGAVLIYILQSWGDMGLGSWIGVFTVAPALAMAGKLAVESGGWGRQKAGVSASVPPPAPAATTAPAT